MRNAFLASSSALLLASLMAALPASGQDCAVGVISTATPRQVAWCDEEHTIPAYHHDRVELTCDGLVKTPSYLPEEYGWPPGPDCGEALSIVWNSCSTDCLPKDCEDEPALGQSNYVGDPVDLTTGYLLRQATDVDLGRGLQFTRYYVSGANEIRSLGWNWSHSLEWDGNRVQPDEQNDDVFVVRDPEGVSHAYLKYRDTQEEAAASKSPGFVEDIGDPGDPDFRFTSEDGTVVEFEHWYDGAPAYNHYMRPSSIKPLGEPTIHVTHDAVAKTTTYSNGSSSLKIYRHTSGVLDNLIAHVVANEGTSSEETISYGYTETSPTWKRLRTVTAPDDLTTYFYEQYSPNGRLVKEERSVGGATTTMGEWDYEASPERASVASTDEKTLDQSLKLSYTRDTGGELIETVVEDSLSQELATVSLEDGVICGITGDGGPGYELPYRNATTVWVNGAERWHTKEDPKGYVKLYEGHDARGNPARVVEGWVDNDADEAFSAGDGYARLTEYTYHPFKNEPLTITRESTFPGQPDAKTTFGYDAPGDPVEATSLLYGVSRSGNTLDEFGSIVSKTYETTYTYNADGKIETISGPREGKNFTRFVYDPVTGYRTAIRRYLDGDESTYLETTFSNFDSRGNPQTVTDPNGQSTTFLYDDHDRITEVTPPYSGPESATISFDYDADGNLERVDFPQDSHEHDYYLDIGYDGKGNVTYIVDANRDAIVYEYESSRRTREARYSGFVEYDGVRGTLEGDAHFDYNAAGRLFQAFNPLPGSSAYTEYGYDGNGNNTAIKDENDKQDTLLYDALNRLDQIDQVRTATYKTDIEYDSQSNVALLTDPFTGPAYSKATEYKTDDFGRLVEVVSPDTGTTRFLYDEAGNLTKKIEAVGVTDRTTSYTYDGLDRILTVDYPTDADWVFTYDTDIATNQMGRLALATNQTVTTSFEYTARGEVAVESLAVGAANYFSVAYTYDAAGNIETITDPNGVEVRYHYAGARPDEIDVTAAGQTETIQDITWWPFGPREGAKFPPYDSGGAGNVVVSGRQYNLRGQVEEIEVVGPQGVVVDRGYTYDYTTGSPGPNDPGPNLDRMEDSRDASQSRFYFYDELDRLGDAKLLSGAADESFLYDASGNRTQWMAPGGTTNYSYEPDTNRLSQATGAGARYYAHDAYGNRIYEGSAPYSGTPSLIYNEANRLVEVRDADNGFASLETYLYDAFGRRVAKSSESFYYIYSQAAQLLARVDKNTGDDFLRSYIYAEDELVGFVDQVSTSTGGCAGLPPVGHELRFPDLWWLTVPAAALLVLLVPALRRRPIAATGVVTVALVAGSVGVARSDIVSVEFFWVHTDHLGTPLAVTDTPADPATAKVVWRATYEAFGNATVDEDPDGDSTDVTFNVRFPGQYYDEESGLHYNFYRTYDPNTGRYLEADPVGQHFRRIHLYSYARNAPTMGTDPTGESLLRPPSIPRAFWDPADSSSPPGPLGGPFPVGHCGTGRGEEWLPDLSTHTQEACKAHDKCYATCGKTRAECDRALFVKNAAYGLGAMLGGRGPYNRAQEDAGCRCVPGGGGRTW
jgi:RHS repeat-associated protein